MGNKKQEAAGFVFLRQQEHSNQATPRLRKRGEGAQAILRQKGRGNTFDFPRVREKETKRPKRETKTRTQAEQRRVGPGRSARTAGKRRAANEKYQKAISKEAPSNFTLREASLGAREPASSAAVARVPRERDAARPSPWKRRYRFPPHLPARLSFPMCPQVCALTSLHPVPFFPTRYSRNSEVLSAYRRRGSCGVG